MRGCLGAPAIAALFWLAAARILAQSTGTTTGDLRGQIEDESGAALPGASLAAVSPNTGFSRSAVSGNGGEFILRFLPPGAYDVTASRKGFQTLHVARVVIVVGTTASLRLTMPLESVAETVSVDARPQSADLASTGLASTVTQTEIRNLPINRRNFLDFALTTPGVTLDRGPQTGAATTSGFSVNGQNPRSNNVMLDGLDDNDAAVGAVRSTVTQEAVLEYQVIRAPYSPEYGRAGGGVINVATRSGSNDLQATAFLFYRDQNLSGRNALTGTKTPYEQFQYGAALSGPVLADRLFFFAAAERLDVTDVNEVRIAPEDAQMILEKTGVEIETGVLPYSRGHTSVFAKLDAAPAPSQAWALRGTWSSETDENQQPWGVLVARSGGGVRDIRDAALGVTGISLFGAGASNEFRGLYADRRQTLESLDETGGPAVTILGVATFGTQQFLPQPRDSRTFQIFEAISFFGGWGSGKIGVDYVRTNLQGSLPLYFHGLYEFLDLPGLPRREAFLANVPAVVIRGSGNPEQEVSTDLFSAFAQGEWTVGNRLLIRAGFRYDYEKPADPFPADSNNWAPRLSFSWALSDHWRIRGGVGRFYSVAPIGPMFAVGIENGVDAKILVQTVVEPEPLLAVFRRGDFQSASTDLASLGVDLELPRGWVASADYVHARGRGILVERNINPFDPEHGRNDPTHSDIRLYESTGNSWYDGITVAAATGVGRPLRLSASYTYADAQDDYIDFSVGQPQDPLDLDGELGPTIHVPKHRATLTAVFTSPSTGRCWSRDWVFSAISDVAIGRPYNILAGFDRNGDLDGSSDRPVGVGRNAGTLPPFWNVDLRVGRRLPVGPLAVEATLDFFNLLGRANVLDVDNFRYVESEEHENETFGTPTRVADPRRLQFGVRISF